MAVDAAAPDGALSTVPTEASTAQVPRSADIDTRDIGIGPVSVWKSALFKARSQRKLPLMDRRSSLLAQESGDEIDP